MDKEFAILRVTDERCNKLVERKLQKSEMKTDGVGFFLKVFISFVAKKEEKERNG